jgi:hypothetical protein
MWYAIKQSSEWDGTIPSHPMGFPAFFLMKKCRFCFKKFVYFSFLAAYRIRYGD